MSSKVDFLPAGLLLFLVSELYVVGYVHLVEWEFCRQWQEQGITGTED